MNRLGYSLVEVVFATLLTSILAGVAIPPVQTALSQYSVMSATSSFRAKISLARSTAVRMGGARLRVDTSRDRLWVEADTSGSGSYSAVGTPVDFTDQAVEVITHDTLFCFDARGIATSGTGCASGTATVIFARGAYADTVWVTPLGKVLR